MRKNVGAVLGGGISLCLHGALMLWLVQLPDPPAPEANVAHADVPLEAGLPAGLPDGVAPGRVRVTNVPVVFGGPASAQNLDTGRLGRGGDAQAPERTALLASRAHAVLLQDTPLNAVDVSQRQRIATADDRASWENRRATPNPNDQPFLASGDGTHRERRPVAERDAQSGAPRATPEATFGADASANGAASNLDPRRDRVSGDAASPLTRVTEGSDSRSPGVGIAGGRGAREARAADVAMGRPPVDEGPAATTSVNAARVRDDTDAELLADGMIQSWVDATPGAAPNAGRGRGGDGATGDPGAGGESGPGGRATPHAPGPGSGGALDTRDPRYRRWYLSARRRVQSAMRFPRQRALQMDQGVAVYSLVVDANGRLVGTPRRTRSSGFADVDAAALRAIVNSAPFGPLPSDLMAGRRTHTVRMTLNFSNPLVR